MNGNIHSLETFGTVDGPGIRFVIFTKGCPMRCLYCHNPDTWSAEGGTSMSTDELLEKYESCRNFAQGGITVTGGEPLVQIDFVTELFRKAHEKNIHTCLDTSGIVYKENDSRYDELMKYTDLVMLDIKHIDSERHIALTGQDNKQILAFAQYVSEKNVPLWIRHVVVPNVTDNEDYLYRLGRFVGSLPHVKALDILPYHTMGEVKYKEMGMDYQLEGIPAAEKNQAASARQVVLRGITDQRRGN